MQSEQNVSTLFAMDRPDEPFKPYYEEVFDRDMAEAKTPQEAIRAVVQFANSSHSEQASEEAISPYGGLDIVVFPVEALAYCELDTLVAHPACAGMDRLAICKELYAEMEKRGIDTEGIKDFIESYETKAMFASEPISPFFRKEVEHYEAAVAWADHIAREDLDAFRKEGDALFQEAAAGLEKLERKGLGLYKWIFPQKYMAQKADLEKQRLSAEEQKKTTLEDMMRDYDSPRYEEAIDAVPPLPYLLDEPVSSTEELQLLLDRFYKETSDPMERDNYLKACFITEREPVPIPKQGATHLMRASVRAAIQQAERPANAQRQRALPHPTQEREY